jgi:hypothetical protein
MEYMPGSSSESFQFPQVEQSALLDRLFCHHRIVHKDVEKSTRFCMKESILWT